MDKSVVFVTLLGMCFCGFVLAEHDCPKTYVVLVGTNVSFTCIQNDDAIFIINGHHHLGASEETDNIYRNRSFTWRFITNKKIRLWVLASVENNGTSIQCIGTGHFDPVEKLIVVEGPPGPPEAPTLTVTNLTALTLTWTAPWPHPISNYTITMLNLSSGQESQWTTHKEQFVLRGGGGGQCDELQFTVKAETEVGSSGPSSKTTVGFSRGFHNKSNNQTVVVTCHKNTSSVLQIDANPPEVCPYETLEFTLNVTDLVHGWTMLYGPTSQHSFQITSNVSCCTNDASCPITGNAPCSTTCNVSCSSTYNVSLLVRNEAGESFRAHTQFNQPVPASASASISDHPCLMSTPVRLHGTVSTLPTPSPSLPISPVTPPTMLVELWLIIIISVAAVVIICCLVILTCGILSAVIKHKRTRGVVSHDGRLDEPLPFGILKTFAENPIYERPIEATYETIPYQMELRSLPPPYRSQNQETSFSPSINSQSPRLMDQRNGIADKGQFSVVQHSQDGEYITMSRASQPSQQPPASPRYTESPFLMFPTTLEPLPEHPDNPSWPAVKHESHTTPFQML